MNPVSLLYTEIPCTWCEEDRKCSMCKGTKRVNKMANAGRLKGTKMEITLMLDESNIPHFATGSLMGTLIKLHPDVPQDQVTKVTLIFPQSTASKRMELGGPIEYIIPEYVIPCILEDVILLQSRGVKITIQMPQEIG